MNNKRRTLSLSSPWVWCVPLFSVVSLFLLLVSNSNEAVFLMVNQWPRMTGSWLWANITIFGDTLVIFCLALPFVGRRPDLIWGLILAALIATLLVHGMKGILDVGRPVSVIANEQLTLIGYIARANSFPSGHTAGAFSLAGILCMLPFQKPIKFFALSLAALVGLSRMAVGIHWPLDVIGGMMTGWLAAIGGLYFSHQLAWGFGRTAQRSIALLFLSSAFYLLFLYDSGYPQARIFQIVIAFLCLLLALPGILRLMTPIEEKGSE